MVHIYLYSLKKYLQAQLDIAKNTPVVYPADYYITDRQLFKLNKLASQLELVEDVKTYYYLSSPDYPVVKDNPKRALILAIGFIIGILLPTFFILLGSVIQTNKKAVMKKKAILSVRERLLSLKY